MELELTKKDNTAMYFAVQALITAVVGAISSGLIYEYIKGVDLFGIEKGGLAAVPVIVSIACIGGAIACIKMPRRYTRELVAEQLGVKLENGEAQSALEDK